MFKKRSRPRKVAKVVGLLAGGGFLLSGPGTGCGSYLSESLLVATDFCFIFDCQNGFFGGVIDPCADTDGNAGTDDAFFVDCANAP